MTPTAPRDDPQPSAASPIDTTRPLDTRADETPTETRLVAGRPSLPGPRDAEPSGPVEVDSTLKIPQQASPAEPDVVVRFGPGVPAKPRVRVAEAEPKPRSQWGWRALNLVLTAALAALVAWLLWPSPTVQVREVSVSAPAAVGCNSTAGIVATLRTNGKPGTIHYRWIRNDGVTSGVLTAKPARGQHTVDVQLRWGFTGPGTYAAIATIAELEPNPTSVSNSFTYRC